MPSPFTSGQSIEDAQALARNLGMETLTLPIDALMDDFDEVLAEPFEGRDRDETEENIQARIRGTLVMALANKLGHLALATGNKSESAVGFATLYGDMAGGFAPIIDVEKQLVYELAGHRNERGPAIPQRVLERAPSAELAPEQEDEDRLPPYEVLDDILRQYVEQVRSVEEIVASGHDEATVREVMRMVDGSEFKRRQAAPGVKISERSFGMDRRMPITNAWRPYRRAGAELRGDDERAVADQVHEVEELVQDLALVDDVLDPWVGLELGGDHGEQRRVGAKRLVRAPRELDPRRARAVPALADERERSVVRHRERVVDGTDLLVELAEHRLVAADPLSAWIHADRSPRMRGR
jgi:NAD+ synthetase